MTQYIDKDALVAEIERRIRKARDNANTAKSNNNPLVTCVWSGHEKECHELISFIDTLEMKEVDIDEEFSKCCENYIFDDECEVYTAKHFFELGLKIKNK